MILTDGIHLVSDISEDELHTFAKKIGLKRRWYQDVTKYRHYDLTTERAKKRAIKAGARIVGTREILSILQKREKINELRNMMQEEEK